MKFYSIILYLWVLTFHPIKALPNGTGPASCQTMYPSGFPGFGHYNAIFRDFGFRITAVPASFAPGSDVTVMLTGEQDYRGILFQVRDGEDLATSKAVGSWRKSVIPNLFKLRDCSNVDFEPNSVISHASAVDKPPFHNFLWTAPDCVAGQKFFIKVTIVKNLTAVQDFISVPITCSRSESSLNSAPSSTDNCVNSALTKIQPDYNNTFEGPNFFKGWKLNITGGYTWQYNRGPTISKGTGPSGAYKDLRYLYTEASHPSVKGEVAILETRKDLRGCFCLKMAYSFNVRGKGHSLVIKIGDEVKLRVSKPSLNWVPISYQVDTPKFIKVQIIATRGSTYQGDIAIDEIRFIPGRC